MELFPEKFAPKLTQNVAHFGDLPPGKACSNYISIESERTQPGDESQFGFPLPISISARVIAVSRQNLSSTARLRLPVYPLPSCRLVCQQRSLNFAPFGAARLAQAHRSVAYRSTRPPRAAEPSAKRRSALPQQRATAAAIHDVDDNDIDNDWEWFRFE